MYNPQAFQATPETYNYGNPLTALIQGYQAVQLPSQLQQQKQNEAMKNALLQQQVQYQPQEDQAKLALLKAQTQNQNQNQYNLTGDIGNSVAVENMAKQYGEDDPRVKAARASQKRAADYQESLSNYRGSLADTAIKRASTNLGKTEQELDDIKAGFAPGTNRSQPIPPEQQQQLIGQYNLQIQKSTTDQQARAKTLNATNIDKTLGFINPDSLLQYSGASGAIEKAADAAMAPFKQSKKYTDYTKNKASAEMLATQVRQFYGDSIQPSMIARLEGLTNPESLGFTKEQAKENLNQITNILKNETQTYRDALKSTSAYQGQSQGNSVNPVNNQQQLSTQNIQNSSNNTDIYTAPDNHIVTLKNGQKMTVAEYKKSKGIQ